MQTTFGESADVFDLPIGSGYNAFMHDHKDQQLPDGLFQNEYVYGFPMNQCYQAITEVEGIRYPSNTSSFSPSHEQLGLQGNDGFTHQGYMDLGGIGCTPQGFDMTGWSGGDYAPFAFTGQGNNDATAMPVHTFYNETSYCPGMPFFSTQTTYTYPPYNDPYSHQTPLTMMEGPSGFQGFPGEYGEPSLTGADESMASDGDQVSENTEGSQLSPASGSSLADTPDMEDSGGATTFTPIMEFGSNSLLRKTRYSRPVRFGEHLTITSPTLTGEEETGLQAWRPKRLKYSRVNDQGFAKLYFRYPWKLSGNTRSIDPTAGMRTMTDLGLWDGEDDETLRQKYTEGEVRPRYIEWVSIVEHPLFTFSERSPEGG